MTGLPTELLEQARHLLNRHRRRPRQASLRRAISTAYYALFHLLVGESCRVILAGSGLDPLIPRLGRAFAHAEMKDVAKAFESSRNTSRLPTEIAAMIQAAPSPDLELVATAFWQLQELRHVADYDTGRDFDWQEVEVLVNQAREAFRAWHRIRTTPEARAFLVSLLVAKRWNRA